MITINVKVSIAINQESVIIKKGEENNALLIMSVYSINVMKGILYHYQYSKCKDPSLRSNGVFIYLNRAVTVKKTNRKLYVT